MCAAGETVEDLAVHDVVCVGDGLLLGGVFEAVVGNHHKHPVRDPTPRQPDVQLTMAEDGVGQVDAHAVEGLALHLVDGHGEGRP